MSVGCRTEKDLVKAAEVQNDGLENWLLETQTEKELAIDSPGDMGTLHREKRTLPGSGHFLSLGSSPASFPSALSGNCQGSYGDCFLLLLTVCYLLGGLFSVWLTLGVGRTAFVF